MRALALLALLAVGCDNESGFQNNPDDPVVPQGDGSMEVTPTALDWTDMQTGVARSQSIIVKNIGDGVLQIDSGDLVDSANGQFFTDEDANSDVELDAGEEREIIVVCDPDGSDATFEGLLRLKTNDADSPVLDIPLTAAMAEGDSGG